VIPVPRSDTAKFGPTPRAPAGATGFTHNAQPAKLGRLLNVLQHGPLPVLRTRSFRPHHGRLFHRMRIGCRSDACGSHTLGTSSRGRSLEEQSPRRAPERRGPAALGPGTGRMDGVRPRSCIISRSRPGRVANLTRTLGARLLPSQAGGRGLLIPGAVPTCPNRASPQRTFPHGSKSLEIASE
jgi:hypothetical protein